MSDTPERECWPVLPLAEWEATKQTLQRFTQIVGKIRLGMAPYRNHWWNVTLRVTTRGLTTRPVPAGDGRTFAIDFDFIDHRLELTTSDGGRRSFPLEGLSVAAFNDRLFEVLADVGIQPLIVEIPYDLQPATPFPRDDEHASYDHRYAERWWRILVLIDQVFEEFSGRFVGKSSPTQLFWHTFDFAVTRFSGNRAPERPGADRVTREAYSHEVVSFGFWAGDDQLRAPAFYSYTWPDPPGLNQRPLRPEAASWGDSRGSAMALLLYDELRQLPSPGDALLEFLQSAYEAGASAANWDVEALTAHPAV